MAQPSVAGFLMLGLGHERWRAARRRRARRGAAAATAILSATLSASALAGGAAPSNEKLAVHGSAAQDAAAARPAPAVGRVLSLIPRRAREFLDPPRHAFPILARPEYGEGIGAGRGHEGQDMFAAPGTSLVAVSGAIVLETGYDGGSGNYASIYDPAADRTYNYFHMLEPAMVAAGDHVRAGQQLGKLGCTGSCWGYHLHFEERAGRGTWGPVLDPMPLLSRLQRLRAG